MTDALSAPPRLPYYTARYCEENVWHLSQDARVGAGLRWVVFVSNAARRCPMWLQRAAPRPELPIGWDYHVVLLVRHTGWQIWDVDSRLPCPVAALEYLRETFPYDDALPTVYRPRFRVVPAETFVQTFASDRSHMRTPSGRWRATPPASAPIRTAEATMNLEDFVDSSRPFVGERMGLSALRRWISGGAHDAR